MVGLAAVGLAVVLAPVARRDSRKAAAAEEHGAPALAIVARTPGPDERAAPAEPPAAADLSGLDLAHIGLGDDGATAPLDRGRTARLTVDPILQSVAWSIMATRHIPEASVVLLDPQSGEVLAYASHLEAGAPRDLLVEARAPAASVFKIVTASALVDDAGMGPDTRQCYSGGEERILPSDLVDNPARDRWCVTLGGAMGRSINAVFARLASKHLDAGMLERAADHFGFGQGVAFDVKVEPSTLRVPEGTLGFARTAAGFWNTTLSPIHAAWISAAIERGGEPVRPYIVREVVSADRSVVETTTRTGSHAPVVRPPTAAALTSMMEHTVAEGTSFRAFHDARRTPFLPGITVAGKTGTLTDDHAQRYYTWFTGFAPSHPVPGVRPVAVAALVVNGPSWRVKANVVAREMLQAYFAEQKVPGVSRPKAAGIKDDTSD
jgi:cell division protein FtsI/penicillin-binding protein 2